MFWQKKKWLRGWRKLTLDTHNELNTWTPHNHYFRNLCFKRRHLNINNVITQKGAVGPKIFTLQFMYRKATENHFTKKKREKVGVLWKDRKKVQAYLFRKIWNSKWEERSQSAFWKEVSQIQNHYSFYNKSWLTSTIQLMFYFIKKSLSH